MQKRSKIIIGVCVVLLAYLVAIAIPIQKMSKPDFSRSDAEDMLEGVRSAFMDENTSRLLSYAHPDVKLAKKNLKQIKVMLNQAFRNLSSPEITLSNIEYTRYGDSADVSTVVRVSDSTAGDVYSQKIKFVIKRRSIPHLLGLLTVYEWKIASVEAPNLPETL